MRRDVHPRLSVQALNRRRYPPGGVARAVAKSLRSRQMASIHHKVVGLDPGAVLGETGGAGGQLED